MSARSARQADVHWEVGGDEGKFGTSSMISKSSMFKSPRETVGKRSALRLQVLAVDLVLKGSRDDGGGAGKPRGGRIVAPAECDCGVPALKMTKTTRVSQWCQPSCDDARTRVWSGDEHLDLCVERAWVCGRWR